ncbi:hypothetical protein B7R74_19400 [Yersinia pseudotuberculosis]|uniref:Uncharacterized protein n=2 Tax=Yersinia pseudotuberculosis complex TaxID=1649845 RepID=A0A0T9JAF8_YERPU|nr:MULTISPECIES: hypothetical protein [Yersinia pseudotuberculosis complex]PSH13333.1 hypothetical protein B7R74_19400 [Yersinia pseudotuberculosis]CNC18022.1 Uncharacterised protein [Yersinia pseudotuberculosis]CRG48601.1 Uncharacterised protein [Yersinia wautersii]SUP82047.1 Uncharacterised protein [Yersinia pseudotuberculosis]
MKKYGIHIDERDNTIGFRDHSTWEEWFDTEIERDEKYSIYTQNTALDLRDMMIEQDIANSPYIDGDEVITRTYSKIEKAS